jgi:PAS domain-containing protein
MDVVTPLNILILMGAASIAALFVLWVSGLFLSGSSGHATQGQASPRDAFFLFQDDRLTDMDIGGKGSVDDSMEESQSWEGFRTVIWAQFPDLPNSLADLPEDMEVRFPAIGEAQGARLLCHRQGEMTRLRLTLEDAPTAWDILNNATAHHYRINQIKALHDAPNAVCVTDRDGRATWHNPEWASLPAVVAKTAVEESGADVDSAVPSRRITDTDTGRAFELRIAAHDTGRSLYVSEVTGLVRAENAQRKFVQTLTKTFANLTTGLAVFDRNQELADRLARPVPDSAPACHELFRQIARPASDAGTAQLCQVAKAYP